MTEWNPEYERCRFSITCETDDFAVVHCLRALCQFAERGLSHPQIAWGGTGGEEWRENEHQITLRFSDAANRDAFITAANDALRAGSWREITRNDNDPARRQRVPR